MKMHCGQIFVRAFCKVELIVTLALILSILFLSWLWIHLTHRPRNQVTCQGNLGIIEFSFREYAGYHDDAYPWMLTPQLGGTSIWTNRNEDMYHHFTVFTNRLKNPSVFICPNDSRTKAYTWAELRNSNVSYFLNYSANINQPETILAGDRNIIVTNEESKRQYAWDAKVGLHQECGNVLFADGSTLELDSRKLNEKLAISRNPARLAIP